MSRQKLFRFVLAMLLGTALVLSAAPPALAQPANDNFANAAMISELPFTDSLYTYEATMEPGEPTPLCAYGYDIDRTIWYAFTPVGNGLFSTSVNAWFFSFHAVYTGSSFENLSEVDCNMGSGRLELYLEAGKTYYFQVGGVWGDGGYLEFSLIPPPSNDDFANATLVETLPFNERVDATAASLETGEKIPSCVSESPADRTVWYAFTPEESGFFSANNYDSWIQPFLAVYTGSVLDDLQEKGCRTLYGMLTLQMEAGTTYYFQVGALWGEAGQLGFGLDVAPQPEASFWFYPDQPSTFDTIWFYDGSWDPGGMGFQSQEWDFGDGTIADDCCPSHQYAADGDYIVQLTVTTWDGRTASTSRVVSVRTHDVAITRFAVPGAAKAGQTRSISVGINSRLYPENVEVVLFKSVPGGYEWVGSLRQYVPVRPANRTTNFGFNYTFTSADAQIGKVTFRAQANIIDARDALPADNEAIAPPTTVR